MSSNSLPKNSPQSETSSLFSLPGLPNPARIKPRMQPAALAAPLRAMSRGPQEAWHEFTAAGQNTQGLFENYVFFLAALPPAAAFIGQAIFGNADVFSTLVYALLGYVLSICYVYAFSILASKTATMFEGNMSVDNAAKLIVYSFMPFFIAGIFFVHPSVSMFSLIGAYGFALLYFGIKALSGVPAQKVGTYYMVNVVAWIVAIDLTVSAIG